VRLSKGRGQLVGEVVTGEELAGIGGSFHACIITS
jgi:hypothetical protein